MRIKSLLFRFTLVFYPATFTAAAAEMSSVNSETTITTPTPDYNNLLYVNAGGLFWFPSASIGYQRKILRHTYIVTDVNLGGYSWQDVDNNASNKNADNLNLSETYWAGSFILRFFKDETAFKGWFCSLIAAYYQDNLTITKGAGGNGLTEIQGDVSGGKKISGLAFGADIGYSFRFDHLTFMFAFGYIFALPQNIPYTITNGGTVEAKNLARGVGNYAFGPRITIAAGYAF